MDIDTKHIYSFFENERECIRVLLNIHNNGNLIELDPMYNKGSFYRDGVIQPPLRFDLYAEVKGYDAVQGDARCLPVADASIGCMILDPPFMFGTHGDTRNNVSAKRYTMFDTFADLKACYTRILAESYRILKPGGILLFKCQDYTDGRTTMTHCLVWLWAARTGFYAKDIAILNRPIRKIYNGKLQQRHLRKSHCYFFLFQKAKPDPNTTMELQKINERKFL